MFLDNTLNNIIKRFEDEFPDTRVSVLADSGIDVESLEDAQKRKKIPDDSGDLANSTTSALLNSSDNEDAPQEEETAIKSPSLSRSNSILSLSSKALADEEGRVLRAGHKLRVGIVDSRPYAALLTSAVKMVGADPNHIRVLHELLEELNDEVLNREVREKGVVRVFKERKGEILARLREADPVSWDRFVESQEMARKNVMPVDGEGGGGGNGGGNKTAVEAGETAVEED